MVNSAHTPVMSMATRLTFLFMKERSPLVLIVTGCFTTLAVVAGNWFLARPQGRLGNICSSDLGFRMCETNELLNEVSLKRVLNSKYSGMNRPIRSFNMRKVNELVVGLREYNYLVVL